MLRRVRTDPRLRPGMHSGLGSVVLWQQSVRRKPGAADVGLLVKRAMDPMPSGGHHPQGAASRDRPEKRTREKEGMDPMPNGELPDCGVLGGARVDALVPTIGIGGDQGGSPPTKSIPSDLPYAQRRPCAA